MKITKTFYAPNRKAWHQWLKHHSKTEKAVRLIYYRGSLKANPQARESFQSYSGAYQRIRIADVDGAKKRPAPTRRA